MKIIKSRIFKVLVILSIIGFICGIILYFIISKEDKLSIESNLINYFNLINNGDFDYIKGLINNISDNIKYLSIIFIIGVFPIVIFILPLIIIFKSILIGFGFINIIMVFNIKGLIMSLILYLFSFIYIFLLLVMSYHSIKLSIKIYKIIKYNKEVYLKDIIKPYFVNYLILSLFSIIISTIDIFFISNIIKLIV